MSAPADAPARPEPDLMPLLGIDHVELWVGNAAQAAFFLQHAYGFSRTAYRGLETGSRETTAHVLQQGRIRLVLTGTYASTTQLAEHHRRHGDGIRDIALSVPDAVHAHDEAVRRGATSVQAPQTTEDEHGTVTTASIAAYGETVHSFVDRSAYDGPFLPGFQAVPHEPTEPLLLGLDHVVGNVALGDMDRWVAFYGEVLGMAQMTHFTDRAISTEYSALMSKVVSDGSGRIKFPINEPAQGRRRSQIDEYLEFYEGPGAQHLALATRDLLGTVAELKAHGVEFLQVPDAYYDDLPERVPAVADQVDQLRAHGVLVDRDDEGYLLQLFTKPVGDRPTVFFELIERHGARGFGEGNFRALFEAIEREQDARGNL